MRHDEAFESGNIAIASGGIELTQRAEIAKLFSPFVFCI